MSKHEIILTVVFQLRESTNWAEKGHEVAWFQQQLLPSHPSIPRLLGSTAPMIHSSKSTLTIVTAKSTFTFSRVRGLLKSWNTSTGAVIILDSMVHKDALKPGFWRPPTDNDMPKLLPHWRALGVDNITSQLRSMEFDQEGPSNVLTITTKTFIAPLSLGWGWHATTIYQILPDGSALSVFVHLEQPVGKLPQHLPRMGFDLILPNTLEYVKWFGCGPGESYPDKKSSQRISIWNVNDISQLQTQYDIPQENGNHADTRWLELSTIEAGPTVRMTGIDSAFPFVSPTNTPTQPLFNFTVTPYSPSVVEKAAHPCDLIEQEVTTLRLDAAVSGLGTGACGPGTREDQMVRPTETSYGFLLALR